MAQQRPVRSRDVQHATSAGHCTRRAPPPVNTVPSWSHATWPRQMPRPDLDRVLGLITPRRRTHEPLPATAIPPQPLDPGRSWAYPAPDPRSGRNHRHRRCRAIGRGCARLARVVSPKPASGSPRIVLCRGASAPITDGKRRRRHGTTRQPRLSLAMLPCGSRSAPRGGPVPHRILFLDSRSAPTVAKCSAAAARLPRG
jgi:hypothetical protein